MQLKSETYVSVIIPHYNRADIILGTINSVVSQTYKNWEVIIVDDHSDDYNYNLLTSSINHPSISVYRRSRLSKGPSACRNEGALLAKGKYLLFLDSDDLLAPYCLEQRLTALESSSNIDFGIFLMDTFSKYPGDLQKIYNLTSIAEDDLVSSFIQNINPWNVTCPFWKRDSFLKYGGFDEELFYMEDPEIHIRALMSKGVQFKTFYNLPPDSYYRINYHDDTKQSFVENSIKFRLLFYNKIWQQINQSFTGKELIKFRQDIKIGLINTLNTFLLSRIGEFRDYFDEMYKWASHHKIFSIPELLSMLLLKRIWLTEHKIVRLLRLKGISRKLLIYYFK